MRKFIWTKGMKGPQPQIWDDNQVDGAGKAKEALTPSITLLDNDKRTLDELALEFTYEKCLTLKQDKQSD